MKKIKRLLKELSPLWFIGHSFSYMKGYSVFYIIAKMPYAYYRYFKLCLKG